MKRSSFLELKHLKCIEILFNRIEPHSSGVIAQVTTNPIKVEKVINEVENRIDVRESSSNTVIPHHQTEAKSSKTSSAFDMGGLTSFLSGITPLLLKSGVNFINVLRENFSYESLLGSFSLGTCEQKKLPKKTFVHKICTKR